MMPYGSLRPYASQEQSKTKYGNSNSLAHNWIDKTFPTKIWIELLLFRAPHSFQCTKITFGKYSVLGFTPILCVHLLNLFNGPLRRRRAFDKNNFTPTGSICMYVMYVCRNSACDYNIDDDFIFSTLADGNPKYWIQPYIDDCTVASSSVSCLVAERYHATSFSQSDQSE